MCFGLLNTFHEIAVCHNAFSENVCNSTQPNTADVHNSPQNSMEKLTTGAQCMQEDEHRLHVRFAPV